MVRTSTLYFIKFKENNILFSFSPIPCNESWHLSRCNLEWSISFLLHFLELRGKLVSTIKAGLQDRSLFSRFLIYSKGKYNGEPPSIWRKSSDVALINCKKERVAIASVDYGKGACSKRSRHSSRPLYASLPVGDGGRIFLLRGKSSGHANLGSTTIDFPIVVFSNYSKFLSFFGEKILKNFKNFFGAVAKLSKKNWRAGKKIKEKIKEKNWRAEFFSRKNCMK